jgi:hypothetical protein
LVLAAALMISLGPSATASTTRPSAIGTENVLWLAVSPAYSKTGLVAAVTSQVVGCVADCIHLWVTHDGGYRWKRAKAAGFGGGQPVITVDSAGAEVMYNRGTTALQRSVDGGETWVDAGPQGAPAPVPGPDAAVVVAGETNYILRGGTVQPVAGSGGMMSDAVFALAPGFPSSGSHPPALLVGTDKQSERTTVQRCTAGLSCQGAASLLGTAKFSAPGSISYQTPPDFFFSSNYAKDGVAFVRTAKFIYKSSDGGATFNALKVVDNIAASTGHLMMALSSSYKEGGPVRTAYVALYQTFLRPGGGAGAYNAGGVYRTSNGGATWQEVGTPGPFDVGATAVALAPDRRLFAGYLQVTSQGSYGGLLCSSDAGKTWHAACAPAGAAKGSGTQSAAVGPLPDGPSSNGSIESTPDIPQPKPFWKTAMVVLGAAVLIALGASFAKDRKAKAKTAADALGGRE